MYIYIHTYMHTRIFIQWISMKNRLRPASWCKKQAFFASKPLIELKAPAAVASSKEKKPQVTPSRSLDGWGGSNILGLPSGKHTKNYGKSPFFMGKSTISMAIFNSYVKLPEATQKHPRLNMFGIIWYWNILTPMVFGIPHFRKPPYEQWAVLKMQPTMLVGKEREFHFMDSENPFFSGEIFVDPLKLLSQKDPFVWAFGQGTQCWLLVTPKTTWLVVYLPSEKYESQLGWWHSQYGKIKNVPKHQSATYCWFLVFDPSPCPGMPIFQLRISTARNDRVEPAFGDLFQTSVATCFGCPENDHRTSGYILHLAIHESETFGSFWDGVHFFCGTAHHL